MGRELGTVVTANVVRHAAADEQIAQPFQQVLACELPRHINREAFTRVLIDDRQLPNRTAIGRSIGNEVVALDVIPMSGAQTHAGTIIQPEPPTFGLHLRDF